MPSHKGSNNDCSSPVSTPPEWSPSDLAARIIAGGGSEGVSHEEAIVLASWSDLDELCDAADRITRDLCGTHVDSCSIVNARSGRCSEDCKWCAQASRHRTGCATYNILDAGEALKAARRNEEEGIRRFSLVTSGRSVSDEDLEDFIAIIRRLDAETDLKLCVSMGLLDESRLRRLREAGISRYHCNLETSEGFFPKLCSSHTPADKKATIRAARKVGMKICSGGIIGMGESMADRIDLAFELSDLGVDSAPMNILNPIPGTPLEATPLISEEEVIRTVAVWRFILPKVTIRFAGGRMRLSRESMLRMLRGGVNGVLMGDMLTTISNTVASDRQLFKDADMQF